MSLQLTNIYARQCRHCGKQFEANHGNRNFCKPPSKTEKEFGAKDCKITYNNLIAKSLRDIVKGVNNQTLKNLKILLAFFLKGIYKVSGAQLSSKGFDNSKSTGRALDSKGEYTIPIYYIFQLINLGNDNYLIKKI